MNKRPSYQTIAIFFSATFLPAGLATGTVIGGIIKLINPDNIDVWQPLAYLGYSIVPGLVVGGLFLLGAIINTFLASKAGSGKVPCVILCVNLLLILGLFVGQAVTRTAEDNWARDNGGMTHDERDAQLKEFFKKAADQKAN